MKKYLKKKKDLKKKKKDLKKNMKMNSVKIMKMKTALMIYFEWVSVEISKEKKIFRQ